MRNSIFIILFFLLTTFSGYSQVTAFFTADSSSGCTPLHIQFVNASTGPPGTTYLWEFGGLGVSVEEDPVFTFVNSGTYLVTLTSTNGANWDSYSMSITVFKSPVADFTVTPTQGCAPLLVNFDDATVLGDGPVTSWSWDFDDGSFPTSDPHQTHTFSLPGSYTVKLVVVDTNGCQSNTMIEGMIQTSYPPEIIVTPSPSYACAPPLTTHFTTFAFGTGTLTYSWDFGDGGTSTDQSPDHTYTQYGNFVANITVTDAYGCSATEPAPVVMINDIVAGFQAFQSGDTILNQDTVCTGLVEFSNTTVGSSSAAWIFGDGTSTIATSPLHYYSLPGLITVTMIGGYGTACPDTATLQFTLESVTADFELDSIWACSLPFEIHVQNNSLNADSFYWSTGGGQIDSSNLINPSITYHSPGIHHITLLAFSEHGCVSAFTDDIIITLPEANFVVPTPIQGCVPLPVEFVDSSFDAYDLVDWHWEFGNNDTANGENQIYSYADPGDYAAFLVITNEFGCKDTSDTLMIHPGNISHPAFTFTPDTGCYGDPVVFEDNTPSIDSVETWHFTDFGHTTSMCPYDSIQTIPIFSDTGSVSFTLTTAYNGCYSTCTIPNAYTSLGPYVSFSWTGTCSNPFTYNFTGTIHGATHFLWDFGDGTTDSVSVSPVHTYADTGNYTVNFSAVNDTTGCSVIYTDELFCRNIHADFSINGQTEDTVIVCSDRQIDLYSLSSSMFVPCNEGYYWLFGDGTPGRMYDVPNCTHEYSGSGFIPVTHWVRDINNCKDTITKYLRIFYLNADLDVSSTGGCVPFSVNVNDVSVADTTIINYFWSYGDSITNTTDTSHTYLSAGAFEILLVIEDTLHCTDTARTIIHSVIPYASISTASNYNICAGDSVLFIRVAHPVDSLMWNFGDSTFSDTLGYSVWHTYSDSGWYCPTITTYEYGCMAVDTTDDCANVQSVTGLFNVLLVDTNANPDCYPLELMFQYPVIPNNITDWYWTSGAGGQSVIRDSVRFIYDIPGNYYAHLYVTTSNGCMAHDSVLIQVKGPSAQFSMSTDSVCKGENVIFHMFNDSNVYSFEWDFGDGNPGFGNDPSHAYYLNGLVHPLLIIHVDTVHSCDIAIMDSLFIHEVISNFNIWDSGVYDTASCTPFIIQIENQSNGSGLNWNWQLDGATFSNYEEPLFTVNDPGLHLISLIITSDIGCSDTSTQEIVVFPLPVVTLTPDTFVCEGDTLQLLAGGGVSYWWQPSDFLNSDTLPNPLTSPQDDITYSVVVTDQNNCSQTEDVFIAVQEKPFSDLMDTTLIIGETLFLNVQQVPGVYYNWTPPTGLSCTDCPNPVVFTLDSAVYYLILTDDHGCFEVLDSIHIGIRDEFSFNVPQAFTPNGDGVNDVAYVQGWGIKRLVEFKILNRWGQQVYLSSDLLEGWDGTYLGKIQNIDTYTYSVTVEYWSDRLETKQGYITILK